MRPLPRSALLPLLLGALAPLAFTQPTPSAVPPAIHGALVFAARLHHPFLYRVPITGARPMHISAIGLPAGLTIDAATGIITGVVERPSTSGVDLQVSNPDGTTHRRLQIVIGDKLALTPPMGWSSWDRLQTEVSDQAIRRQADALVSSGLADHGYAFINIDDGWEHALIGPRRTNAPARSPDGAILPNDHFPDMPALTEYLHQRGLKAGLYTSPGPRTCGGFEGSGGHEQQDALTYARWGFDLLKYDLCSFHVSSPSEVRAPYQQMGQLLSASSRDILFSISNGGRAGVKTWGTQVGAQMWRITDDLAWGPNGVYSTWDNIVQVLDQTELEKSAAPGGWNDPDDLVIGQIAYIPFDQKPPNVHIDRILPPPLTPDEQITQMSLWSMLAAPLIIGGDLTTLDEFSIRILGNDEVIAVDQDPLGHAGRSVRRDKDLSMWVRELDGGARAVAVFNLGDRETPLSLNLNELGISGPQTVRDLWKQQDLGNVSEPFHLLVPPHGARLLRASPSPPPN